MDLRGLDDELVTSCLKSIVLVQIWFKEKSRSLKAAFGMPAADLPRTRLQVAIIGGGPAGLAAAIELAKLPFVQWRLYEKKTAISETGGGISIQRHTWRLLEILGAAKNLDPKDYFRPGDGQLVQHR